MAKRTASRSQKGFIWFPREQAPRFDVKAGGDSVKTVVLKSKFMRALIPEIGAFALELENSTGEFSDKFIQGDTVEFFSDLSDGTTRRFLGSIDHIKNTQKDTGFTMILEGGHVTSDDFLLTLITVRFEGDKTADEIYKQLIEDNLAGRGYTTNNVNASTVTPTVAWDAKPLVECIFDLTKLADFDSFVDDDKDCHFFAKESRNNTADAIVWNDTLISSEGIGEQSLTKRDKIQVVGDDGTGLPVLSTSGTGTKTRTIFDNKVTSSQDAQDLSAAELEQQSTVDQKTEGSAQSFVLPTIRPGDMIWITNPPFILTKQIKVYKYVHMFPEETTEVLIQADRQTPHVLKKRVENELSSQSLTNPFQMESSFNMTFDDEAQIASKDTNVTVTNGVIKLSSGVQGSFTTVVTTIPEGMTEVHLKMVGTDLSSVAIQVSTDAGTKLETVALDQRTILVNGVSSDALLVIRGTLNSATAEIDSLALLFK